MSGLAFHQANGSDAAAVTYNTVNGVYGGELWNAEEQQDRRRHQRRGGQEGDGRPRQPDEAARAEGLGQLVHRRGQRGDRPGQGLRRLQLDRGDRRPRSTRSSRRWASRARRSSTSSASRRCPTQDADFVPLGGMGMHISKYAPAERQAEALNFIKWFEQPEIQKKWAAAGGVPSRKDALASPEFLEAAPVEQGLRRLRAAPARHVERPRVREAHQHREHQRQRRAQRREGPGGRARRDREGAAGRAGPERRARATSTAHGRATTRPRRRRRPSWRRRRPGASRWLGDRASRGCSSRRRSRCCSSCRSSRCCGRSYLSFTDYSATRDAPASGSGSTTTSTSSRRARSTSARSRRRSTSSAAVGAADGARVLDRLPDLAPGPRPRAADDAVPHADDALAGRRRALLAVHARHAVRRHQLAAGLARAGPVEWLTNQRMALAVGHPRRHLAVDAVHHADRAGRAHRGAASTSTRPRRSTARRSGSASATSRCRSSGRCC